jgi:hypothetical protein
MIRDKQLELLLSSAKLFLFYFYFFVIAVYVYVFAFYMFNEIFIRNSKFFGLYFEIIE